MKYCEKCGRELPHEANYCPKCGVFVGKTVSEEFTVKSEELPKKIQELIHEGNVTKIIVRDEKGQVLLEIPATIGLVGAILAPWMAALGVIAAIATRCTITVVRKEA